MNRSTTGAAKPEADSASPGPLSSEAQSMGERVTQLRAIARSMKSLDDAQLHHSLRELMPLIDHIAGHGRAEEHVLYPYMEPGCSAEVPVLLEDHARLRRIAGAIAEWTPGPEARETLHQLLDEFCEIGSSHLLVEAEVCLPVVREHARWSEQVLFEAVETEVFDHAAEGALHPGGRTQSPGVGPRTTPPPRDKEPPVTTVTSFSFSVDVPLPYEQADMRVRELLQAEGFGVLTEIDVRATLREKLGVDFSRYEILGTCNPPLAHRALQAERAVGLLLPCNVVVAERAGGGSQVSFMDPMAVLALVGNPAMAPIAADAAQRLRRVAAALAVKA